MVTPGTKPQPTALKVLHGNPGKRPLNDKEPKPRGRGPRMPRGLDDIAKKEWHRMTRILKNLGLLTKIDHAMFEAYCRTYSDWVRFSQKAYNSPVVMVGGKKKKTAGKNEVIIEKGYPMINPFLSLAQKALKDLRAIATEFGLTPSSRSRIRAEGPTDQDDLGKFLGE